MIISLNRRSVIVGASAAAASAAASKVSFAQSESNRPGATENPFHLDPLPYATNVLEPHIDAKTMEIHHDKHHAAYVNNLNNAAKDSPQFAQRPMEEVLANLDNVPDSIRATVRNNMGGHVNHTMYWRIMGANGGKPAGEVLAAIDRDFAGFEKLQADFNAAGGRIFGSGWVFVTVSREGKLAIETRPNQDTPLMEGKRVLFGNDVWEHAYYLNYQNRRADYLKAWWNVIDWTRISERYADAKRGALTI